MFTTITNSASSLKVMKPVTKTDDELFAYLDNASYESLDYYHTSGLVFYGSPNEQECEGSLSISAELESDDFTRYDPSYAAGAVRDLLGYNRKVDCKYDGSLHNGLEIASQPATLAFHMNKYGWSDVLRMLSLTSSSHDAGTCGFHVHVSRKGLGHTDEAKELCIAKLIILIDKWFVDGGPLMKFSRRNSDGLTWCKKNDIGVTDTDSRKAIDEKYKAHKDGRGARDRYLALNLTNRHTIEFRMFRGTHNPETFAATLQLVDTMVKWCKVHTTREVQTVKFGDIVAKCKYAELRNYCIRRGIDISTSED